VVVVNVFKNTFQYRKEQRLLKYTRDVQRMSFEEYRKRHPTVRQKKIDQPSPFAAKPSRLSREAALARKAAIFTPPHTERVQKIIAASGLCSRRQAEEFIAQGRVQVNGRTIKLGDGAKEGDKITVNGAPIPQTEKLYFVLHKPKGYVTTVRDIYGNKTVMELIDREERLYPVGRLDKDTTGLLLMTNDGEFANRVMHPRYEIDKTYIATIDKPFDRKLVETYARGVRLKEGIVRAHVHVLGKTKVSVTLHQGFNHVVKRILNAHGYWVRELVRTRVGPIKLDVPLGAYRLLRQEEKELLMASSSRAKNPSRRR
jgi:23S rRNA pseudouridine2605 synthase